MASSRAWSPIPLVALPTSTGARTDSLTPLRRQASSSGSEISSPSRYFVRTSSSASAAASSSWSRRRATSSVSSAGMADLDLLRAVPAPGLAVDEVDVAAERLGRADRHLERGDLVAERGPQRVEGGRRVGVLAVALVDEEAGRGVRRSAQGDGLLQAGLDPARGVDRDDRAVGRVEALDDLADEVRVAGGVDEGDPRAVVLEGGDRQAERLVPLLLLGLVVEVGRPVVDPAKALDRAGPKEELLGERRLAGAGVTRPGRRCGGGGGQRSSSSSVRRLLIGSGTAPRRAGPGRLEGSLRGGWRVRNPAVGP